VPDLIQQVRRHVRQVPDPGQPRVAGRDGEDLGVGPALVKHPEHRDRSSDHLTAGKRRLLEQHQRVQRLAVLRQRAGDEPVVERVARRGEQHPVQPDLAGLGIHLVLIARTLRGLDDDLHFHGTLLVELV
jgi:hypothetical protein